MTPSTKDLPYTTSIPSTPYCQRSPAVLRLEFPPASDGSIQNKPRGVRMSRQ